MFKRFKSIFRGSPSIPNLSTPVVFTAYASQAIQLITSSNGQLEDDEIIILLKANGIPHNEAIELLLFLPIAFCRQLLPMINWPNYYLEYISENRRIKHLYTDNQRYTIIQEVLQKYLTGNFTKTDYHKIAGRSASFHAINQMLLDNPGRKLSEVLVTPETIVY